MLSYSKIFIVVNPASGIGNSLKLSRILTQQLDSKKFEIKHYVTKSREDFVRVVNENKWEDTLLLLLGGDGSFNQVINEILKNNIPVQIIPIPSGTSNVYNRAIQVEKKNIAWKINEYRLIPKSFRVGEVEYEGGKLAYFFSMCGIGFDAYIVEKLAKIRKKKLYIWSYLTTAVYELFIKRLKPANFRIFVNTQIIENVFFAIFFNIVAYGGPFAFSGRVGLYNEDFLYMIKFDRAGIGSIPSIYTKALKNFLFSLASVTNEADFNFSEVMEAIIDPVSPEKVYVHIDGDPLTTLPVIARKSLKSVTVYS